MGNGKRQHPRVSVPWGVLIETPDGFIDGKIKDISADGAFIWCREALEVNDKIYMALINIPMLNLHLPVRAQVIRLENGCLDCETNHHGIGVRFTKMSAADREFITDTVSEHVKSDCIGYRRSQL